MFCADLNLIVDFNFIVNLRIKMYSQELENLIQAIIADGEITEKERAVLHKRALAEGVDTDELDIMVEGLMAQTKNQSNQALPAPPAAPVNTKQGVVKKCPNCGAPVEAGSVKCTDCGYVFVGVEANSSATRLANQLQEIDKRFSSKHGDSLGGQVASALSGLNRLYLGKDRRTEEMVTTIANFPVPNTKDDLLEFMFILETKTRNKMVSTDEERIIAAYKEKYLECIRKVQMFFPKDSQFAPFLEQYEQRKKISWKNIPTRFKISIYCFAAVFLMLGLPLIIAQCS